MSRVSRAAAAGGQSAAKGAAVIFAVTVAAGMQGASAPAVNWHDLVTPPALPSDGCPAGETLVFGPGQPLRCGR